MTERKWNIILTAGIGAAVLTAAAAGLRTKPQAPEPVIYEAEPQTALLTEVTEKETAASVSAQSTTAASQSETTAAAADTAPLNRDLNTATAEELMRVPGIGETLAAAIVQHREQLGGFRRRDELKEISGIGDGLMQAVMAEFEIPGELPPVQEEPPAAEPAEPDMPDLTDAPETTEPALQGPFEMNAVTREELLTIPGMTEALADEYLSMRGRLRGYQNFNELLLVTGMSPDYAWYTLRDWLYLEGQSEP